MSQTSEIKGQIKIPKSRIFEVEKNVKNLLDYKTKINEYLQSSVTESLEIILLGAINLQASDIHIEPEKEKAQLRIRIDGILQSISYFDTEIYQKLVSRIKLISGLKLNIYNRPQDGRFSILLKDLNIEIRVSALPAEYGESIVLRILNPKSLIGLEVLGLRKELLNIIEKEIKKPNGMIVVTGPTGCGKTTTLYAFLKKIEKPEIKIITIEDPIEYHLDNISQTQTTSEKEYNFANGLKSIMRQDPDVILVGEIRDLETVNTALQAALTGHLVLTTLHTNSAAGVIVRLTALGAKTSNIAPAINLVIAQRLVRKICKECKKLEKISSEEFKEFKKELSNLKIKISKDMKIPKAKGCKICHNTGYNGRTGIFEIFLNDNEIEKFILSNPSIVDLEKIIKKKGMTTIKQDGLIKVMQGITTIKEIKRVVG